MTGGKEGRGHGKVQARFGGRRWGVLERGASRPPYRDAGTVARSAYARAPIEQCPAGSRPTWFGSMRQGVDNLAFGTDAGLAGDRKSVVSGKMGAVRVRLGGCRTLKKKIQHRYI